MPSLYEATFLYPTRNLYRLHQEIWGKVLQRPPEASRDFLYSFAESDFHPGLIVTLRSHNLPDTLPKKRIEPTMNEPALSFTLRANATQRDESGKYRAIRGQQPLTQWLKQQGERNGFHPTTTHCTQRARTLQQRGKRPITLNDVLYSGTLTITQPTLFNQALEKGIGRARGFGYGMVQL